MKKLLVVIFLSVPCVAAEAVRQLVLYGQALQTIGDRVVVDAPVNNRPVVNVVPESRPFVMPKKSRSRPQRLPQYDGRSNNRKFYSQSHR